MVGSERSRGFTLVELLVVAAVVSILAAIAIPQYAEYRKKATDADMEAALATGRVAMEAFYEANDYTYVGAVLTDLVDHGYRQSEGLTLQILAPGASDYGLRACATGGTYPAFKFETTTGIIEGEPGGSCAP